nr:hypothetical protein [Tanacetum cinerariifolium]
MSPIHTFIFDDFPMYESQVALFMHNTVVRTLPLKKSRPPKRSHQKDIKRGRLEKMKEVGLPDLKKRDMKSSRDLSGACDKALARLMSPNMQVKPSYLFGDQKDGDGNATKEAQNKETNVGQLRT